MFILLVAKSRPNGRNDESKGRSKKCKEAHEILQKTHKTLKVECAELLRKYNMIIGKLKHSHLY